MPDAIIVGAGPTGLTLAVDLARRGVDAVLIEAADALPRQSRGKGRQPRSLEVLGVIDGVLSHGRWRQDITLYDGRERLARLPAGLAEPRPDLPYPNIVMIPQWRTTGILADRLTELRGQIRFGTRLESFTDDGETVHVTVATPGGGREELSAAYLVGADGGRSTVRRALGHREGRNTTMTETTTGRKGATITVRSSIAAPPDRVWELIGDLDRWPDRLPTIDAVERIGGGPATEVGSRFRVRQPGLMPATYEITRWEPGRGFAWSASGPGLRADATHDVHVDGAGGGELVLSIAWRGPLAPLMAALIGTKARRYVEQEAATFTRLAEEPEP